MQINYYTNQLTQKQQCFCNDLYNLMLSYSNRIQSPNGLTFEEASECVTAVKYDHPDLFYVDFSKGLYYNHHKYYEYCPEYYYSKDQTLIKINDLHKIIGRINDTFKSAGIKSLYKQILWIHNMLVRNCIYDYEALKEDGKYQAYTLEGPLFNKSGVCLGISMAFKYLCFNCCGVDMIIARGRSLEPGQNQYERHAWNIIVLNSNAAHIDVTWDMCLTSSDRPIRYDYFFLPDIEMMRDHHYIKYPRCESSGLSFFEQTKTQFNSQLELRISVMHKLENHLRRSEKDTLALTFKMKNRRETKEEVNECVKKAIQATTSKSFQYSWSCNEAQSVFSFWIDFA